MPLRTLLPLSDFLALDLMSQDSSPSEARDVKKMHQLVLNVESFLQLAVPNLIKLDMSWRSVFLVVTGSSLSS